ncbi:MAG: AAA family ATPase, partial [Clostridia bacterium]|nr:AAA family ATPase [Clostridia bacterium]
FSDFLTFNSRAIPFDNDELADYLAAYSNAEGRPVLPPGIYDKDRLKDKLSKIIGMDSIKEQIAHFENYIAFRKKAEAGKIKLPDANLHMLFTGNAGTGKTMIARMISTMLYEIGFLPEDKLVEVERKDLVANYLGQTAGKTAGKIQDAIGGVLFIDEAYTLAGDQYGEEAIATLLKAMEDHRNDLVVIFAGYSDKMQKFIDTNPGLSSRIGYKFHFDDYSYDELMKMLELKISSSGITVTDAARERAGLVVKYFMRRRNFGNGRFIDTLWQEIIIRHSACKDPAAIFVIDENDVPPVTAFSTRRDAAPKELKLEDLVGLAQVKEQVRRFRNKIAFEKRAREFGVSIPRGNSHMMFTGNAGTGKTTVARILVRELYEAGIIVENKLIEVTAGDLIGEYVGQTAPKTQAVIDRAMGGVLFIDEAYALAGTGRTADYGQDAVATLIKAMEDNRDQFVVIFAGYTEEMKNFLAMNTGISSRIGYTFRFEDYNTEELTEIYKMKISSAGLVIADEETENAVKALMQYFVSVPNFGNGRFSEKVSDATFTIHAEKCADTDDQVRLISVTREDIPSIEYMIAMMPDGNLLKPSDITEAENLRTAYHETGHALVMIKLFPEASLSRITVSAEGSGALGYVSTAGLTKTTSTSEELRNLISVYMAGIASEKVMTGDYANGGTSDIEKATDTAWNMISRFGMSETGFASRKTRDEKSNEEINKLLKKGFENAEQIIRDNSDRVEKAAALLMKNKTVSEAELREIFGAGAEG